MSKLKLALKVGFVKLNFEASAVEMTALASVLKVIFTYL